jgi:Acyltransferase family
MLLSRHPRVRDDQAAAAPGEVKPIGEHRSAEQGMASHHTRSSATSSRARGPRIVQLDNLKSLLVAWIIACHAITGYTAIGGWPYDEVSEVTLPPMQEFLLSVVLGPTALLVIGTFFFLAGLFAPGEMARHGVSGFVRLRMLRLGVPWVLFTILVWPLFMWFAYRAAGHPLSYWQAFRGRTPFLDSGPLWFVQVLLYVSFGYALWARLGWGRRFHGTTVRSIHLIAVIATIVGTSFIVRLIFPARSQQILDLHLWWWPQCVGMFCLGALVSRQHWAERLPAGLARRCGIAVATTVVVAPLFAMGLGVADFSRDSVRFLGGWHPQALAFDVVEALIVVAGSVWLLGVAQRGFRSRGPVLAASARAAYAAFVLQAPVLITIEIAARQFSWPPLAKAVVVGTLAVAVSFGLGWLLVRRTALGKLI